MQYLRPRCRAVCTMSALCGLLTTTVAAQQTTVPAGHTVIDNCVTAARLSFKAGVNGIVLDERDGAEVAASIVRRYPMIERDGLYPTAVALWRPPKGEWVYATLSQKAHAPHAACFTANVDASKVDMTPTLIRKYFSPAP